MSILDQIKLNRPLPLHEDYSELMQKIEFWEESVEVDEDYYDTLTPNGTLTLPKEECEKQKAFKSRKDNSSPRNYMNGILSKYISTCFRQRPEREEDDFYSNVDLLGTDMQSFMEKKARDACIEGASYFMPDSTATDPILTEAQKKQIGARGYLRNIDSEQVLNWNEYAGWLQEALISLEDPSGVPFVLYLDHENQTRIEINKQGHVTAIGAPQKHGYPFIPLVRILPFNLDQSFIASGAMSQRGINIKLSLEAKEIIKTTFTKYFGSGISPEIDQDGNKKPIEWDNDTLLTSQDPAAKITSLGADASQADSIRQSIQSEVDYLYKSYHMSSTQVQDAQVPSGYALAISREDFNSLANEIVKATENAEKYVTELLNVGQGLSLTAPKYPRKFIQPSMQEDILSLRDLLALDVPNVSKNIAKEQFVNRYFELTPEQKKQLLTELQSGNGSDMTLPGP